MDVDGQNVREIASSAFSSSPPAWSPDGSRIAFAAFFGGGAPEIDLAAADGSARDRFRFAATGPAWSPDGAWIAFASGGRLYVSDVGANVLLQISDDGREPSWIK